MEQFPTEIILDIAAYLDLTGDKPALASLATCSRKYVKIVRPILFRTVCPLTDTQTSRLLLTLGTKVGISALLKELILSTTLSKLVTDHLLPEILENGQLIHLEVLRFQQPCLPSPGTDRFHRLARAVTCNSFFPALRVLEVTSYRLAHEIKANNKLTSSSFPKLEELYLGGKLTFGLAVLPRLRALQARITSADLDRPFPASNLQYLYTPSSIVTFRYLEQLSAVTGGRLPSLECPGRTPWNLSTTLEENGKSFEWMGEAFPQLRYLGTVWIHQEMVSRTNDDSTTWITIVIISRQSLAPLKMIIQAQCFHNWFFTCPD